MGSYIHIDSISIDLADSIGKRDAGKCEHFSIREYVSEIRKKDWKICWPFPVDESDKQQSLQPLDVPKYRCQRCQNSPQEIAAKDIQKDNQIDFDCCSNAASKSGIQQDPMLDTLERREIDLNTTLSCVNDYLPNSNEKGMEAGVVPSRIIDLEIGLEDDLNHQVTSVPSPKNYPDLAPEVHTTKNGSDCNEVSYPEPSSNLKCMEKSSAGICNGGTPADNQCQEDLLKSCTVLGKGTIVMEVENMENTYDHTTGPLLESIACNHASPAGSMDNTVENDFHDDSEKSTGLSRRRPRKVRLMADLLSDNGESKTEQISIQESASHGTSNASAASQAHSILPGKVDIQGGLTLTSTGPSRKRKFPPDEVRRLASMGFQGVENEVRNSEGDVQTVDTVLNSRSNFKDVPAGLGLQDATKGHWSKPETERSHIMGKKKNKKIQVVDNCLVPELPRGHQRENEDTINITDKAYASKTNSSRSAPLAFTGKGMDNFPICTLRIGNEINLSKEKGKMLLTDGELDSLSWQKNNMLVQDSCAYSGEKARSNMPGTISIPSSQGVLNGKGQEEGLRLSLNNCLVEAHVHNKKCIHQIENRLHFSMPFQGGTSKVPQLNWKGSDTNAFGGKNIPPNHPTNVLSGKGVHCEEFNGVRNAQKTIEAVDQLGFMKRYSEQTVEVSEQGTLDDIPMEIVELLAKNQYERCLPDVEHRSSTLEKSTLGRKAQITGGSTVHGKGEMSLLKEGKKEKPLGRPKKINMVTRGENVKPSKRKPVHYFSPFDGNNLGMNNLCPPQPPFGFEVSQSQKKLSSGIQFSPTGSSQLGSARNCQLNGSFEERGSPNATFQAPGGCSLHKNILHQDDEASRIWASLTPNHVSLGYDKKVASSQHPSSSMDITSLQSSTFHKQSMKRDIDLNYMNLNAGGLEKLNRSTGSETFSRVNGEYSFPCKHSGMEPPQNLRGSLDLYSNETIPAMHLLSLMDAGMQSRTGFDVGVSAQMLKRPSYPGDCNTKLEIGTSKPPGTLKRPSSDYYSRSFLSDKQHGCFVGSPTFGASSSTPHDKKFVRATGFNGQNPMKSGKKEKMKSSNSTQQNRVSDQISWPRIETETSLQRKLQVNGNHETSVPYKAISVNSCIVNRNPADLTIPETGNIYMIRGEDLKFEKSIPKTRPRFAVPHGYKQQKNLKGTKMKELSKH